MCAGPARPTEPSRIDRRLAIAPVAFPCVPGEAVRRDNRRGLIAVASGSPILDRYRSGRPPRGTRRNERHPAGDFPEPRPSFQGNAIQSTHPAQNGTLRGVLTAETSAVE
jgi:hypothetical protein